MKCPEGRREHYGEEGCRIAVGLCETFQMSKPLLSVIGKSLDLHGKHPVISFIWLGQHQRGLSADCCNIPSEQ